MLGFLESARRSGGIERKLLDSGVLSLDQVHQLRRNLIVELGLDDIST